MQVAAKAEARVTKRFEQAAHEAAESARQVQKLERQLAQAEVQQAAAADSSEDLQQQVTLPAWKANVLHEMLFRHTTKNLTALQLSARHV